MDSQTKLKLINKFRTGFIVFLVGQAFLSISSFSVASQFKFLPRWLEFLGLAAFIGYAVILVATLLLYRINIHFKRTLIAYAIFIVAAILYDACSASTSDFYVAWATGNTYYLL